MLPPMMEAPSPQTQPARISWVGEHEAVQIEWSDGHVSTLSAPLLRQICPCAACTGIHERPPLAKKSESRKKFAVLSRGEEEEARQSVSLLKAWPVGNYGIGLLWADGHREGIYTFAHLRRHCPSESSGEDDQ
jgi:DUF971 family protein